MLPPAARMSCTCSRMVVPLNSVSSSMLPQPCQPMPSLEASTNASVKFVMPDAAEIPARSAVFDIAMSM